MSLFEVPKSYADMTKKISHMVFFIALIGLFLVSQFSSDFADLMKTISFGLSAEIYGMKFNISFFYLPLIISIFENAFHLHDKISTLLGIRYRYDKKHIIGYFLKSLNMYAYIKSVNTNNRKVIMNEVFYQYASSTKPMIDPHLIYQALGAWSWYWIFLDTLVLVMITGVMLLIHEFSLSSLLLIILVILFLIIVLLLIKNFDCRKYTHDEIDAILSYRSWKRKIAEYMKHALSN